MWLFCLVVLYAAASIADDNIAWWRRAVFYQVYPRSFRDSDGDGIGDIKGMIEKADYFKDLGVDAVWFNPINKSPMKDFGYDISDYTDIEPIFGTVDDLKEFMNKLHDLGIKMVLDFVPNHSSDQHIWFQASSNTSHPLFDDYKNFYVWQPANGTATDGTPIPPNNWLSVFGGSAWEWNEDRQLFYLHQFVKEQPDLNYREPNVILNMTAVLNFWMDKGIDGFRMDSVKFIYENASFPNQDPVPGTNGSTYDTQIHTYDNDQPETFKLLTHWTDVIRAQVLKDGIPRAIFNEVYDPLDLDMKYYGVGNRSMEIVFNFKLLDGSIFSRPADFKKIIDRWMDGKPDGAVANWVIGNHDNFRVTNRYTPELADALNLLTGVLPGVQCVYYGEEIGMEDTFITWNQTVDPLGIKAGQLHYMEKTRDGQRTPMQWDASTSAGFSKNGTTWLPVNPNYWWLNVAAQRAAPTSHFKVFQTMSKARRDPVLQSGGLKVLVPREDTLLVMRIYNDSYYALIINMGSQINTYTSQNLFGQYDIDLNMTVVVTSVNSGYAIGQNMKQGFLSVSLRPKAAILLRSGTTDPVASGTTKETLSVLVLLLFTFGFLVV